MKAAPSAKPRASPVPTRTSIGGNTSAIAKQLSAVKLSTQSAVTNNTANGNAAAIPTYAASPQMPTTALRIHRKPAASVSVVSSTPTSTLSTASRRRLSVLNDTLTAAATSRKKETPLAESKVAGAVPTAASSSSSAANKAIRRRLSIMNNGNGGDEIDGSPMHKTSAQRSSTMRQSLVAAPTAPVSSATAKSRCHSHHQTLSKTGFVPFNPHKVNQDRPLEVPVFIGEERALFGVFDGHGAVGHEVSQYLITHIPKHITAYKTSLDNDPHTALSKALMECNHSLCHGSGIDCTFSGSTGIVLYINNNRIYTCNVGDSRAVLARATTTDPSTVRYNAIALSSDHKPDRPDERARIIASRGRVECCKGGRGEDVGPARVWLATQDVPGLAMSRSFGDMIAASVGVTSKPEIWERTRHDNDRFIVMGSDGVWEFLSNQDVVDIVSKTAGADGSRLDIAVKAIVDEATRKWQSEEEVIDDITALIVWL